MYSRVTEELCDCALERADGSTVEATVELAGKIVALYFSAEWCPPCRQFTPKLAAAYEMANEDTKIFEVIFISSDDDAAAQADYMSKAHGDWLRIPFGSPLRNQLKQRYGCFAGKEQPLWPEVSRRSGIPSLVVVGADGEELEFNAQPLVASQGPTAIVGWAAHAWKGGLGT